MLLFKQQVLVHTAHLRALQSLFKAEEEVVQGSKENPLLNLKNKKTLVANSSLISCAPEM